MDTSQHLTDIGSVSVCTCRQQYSLVPNRRTSSFVKTAAYFAYRFVCCGQVRLLLFFFLGFAGQCEG